LKPGTFGELFKPGIFENWFEYSNSNLGLNGRLLI
jgi:hypothetical protein